MSSTDQPAPLDAPMTHAQLSAALALSEQRRVPHTIGDSEYRVLWRLAEANLKQASAEIDRLREQLAERTREPISHAEFSRFVQEAQEQRARADALQSERDAMRRREQVFHALVCNAFGYDKSIVRALAIWARHNGDAGAKHLAERVIAAEEAARVALPCSEAHPVLAARAAEGDGEG